MTKFSLEERMEYLKEYGSHCMAYSTLQPGMQYFDVKGKGYIAYMEKMGIKYVLSNPICDNNDYEKVINNFLFDYPSSSFIQITKNTADLLKNGFNFYSTQIGIETWFNVDDWNNSGKRKLIRKYKNKANKLGLNIKEISEEEKKNYFFQLKDLKNNWKENRLISNKDIYFLVRPETENEPLTKKYISFIDNELYSYIICDPLFSKNEIIGYNINLTFYNQNFFKGINYFTINEILFDFQKKNLKNATLGLSPLRKLQSSNKNHFALIKILNFLYNNGNFLYNFKGLAENKKEYYGNEIPVFYSSKKKIPFLDLYNIFKLSNII
jgi:lysylphosphatidylglycerol synthetase-like protein (DUF2156 family)